MNWKDIFISLIKRTKYRTNGFLEIHFSKCISMCSFIVKKKWWFHGEVYHCDQEMNMPETIEQLEQFDLNNFVAIFTRNF